MSMKEIASWALNTAKSRGATFCDLRIVDERNRSLATKNGKVGHASDSESLGIGIRVIANGAWGFAATDELSREAVERTAAQAVAIAKSSATVKQYDVKLAAEKPHVAEWSSPCKVDPFSIPIEQNIALLLAVDKELLAVKGVTLAESNLNFRRYEQWFYSSEGAEIHQTRTTTGAGYAAYSFQGTEIQKRSYPNSFGGQFQNKGYELVKELDLPGNAKRIAEQCVALHKADLCPQGRMDLVLDSAQLGLQIHESIGHPIELDRVLGMEAAYAGKSFVATDDIGRLRYGSDIVNITADATLAGGLGTFGFDDEGVPAQSTPIVREGRFMGYLTSRETAAALGQRSNGAMRASGWNRIPIIRMTNVSIEPGTWDYNDLIADTDDGIYMESNRSWSIDDKRYNFQFGTEIGYEIKNGKLGKMLKNCTYTGITPEFWNSCDAVCNDQYWFMWGTPNCGKGQPGQVAHTGHGAAPARFRNVQVGVMK